MEKEMIKEEVKVLVSNGKVYCVEFEGKIPSGDVCYGVRNVGLSSFDANRCQNCSVIKSRIESWTVFSENTVAGRLKENIKHWDRVEWDMDEWDADSVGENTYYFSTERTAPYFKIPVEKLNQLFRFEPMAAKRSHIAKRSVRVKLCSTKSDEMIFRAPRNPDTANDEMLIRDGVDPHTFIIPEPEPEKPYPSRLNASNREYTDALYAKIMSRKMTPG